MRIDSKEKIAGIPILTVRNFLRRSGGSLWQESDIAKLLHINEDEAALLLATMLERGLVVRADDSFSSSGVIYYENTPKGFALSIASAARPVRRKVAEKAFQEFMERVRTVNADPYYIYKVTKVVLFGSFLSDSEFVGDVDIAIDLVPKEKDKEIFGQQLEQRRAEAVANGRVFKGFLEKVTWPQHEVWLFLKSRSHVLSFHYVAEPVLKQTECKVVFEESDVTE